MEKEEHSLPVALKGDSKKHLFKYLPFNFEGNNYEYLYTGIKTPDVHSSFEVVTSEGRKSRLPDSYSTRILAILSTGWSSQFTYNPFPGIPKTQADASPPCSFVMMHIAFGLTEFTQRMAPPKIMQTTLKFTLSDIIDELSAGDVITLSNRQDRWDKNTVIYLGNSIFLSWSPAYCFFYFHTAQQLHDFAPKKYELLKLSQGINLE